jgi:hypothetical protein
MEQKKCKKKNASVKFTEFMMKKEEAPYEMEICVR